jgi:hypothetical protein
MHYASQADRPAGGESAALKTARTKPTLPEWQLVGARACDERTQSCQNSGLRGAGIGSNATNEATGRPTRCGIGANEATEPSAGCGIGANEANDPPPRDGKCPSEAIEPSSGLRRARERSHGPDAGLRIVRERDLRGRIVPGPARTKPRGMLAQPRDPASRNDLKEPYPPRPPWE